jgi:hypothetical protein
MPLKNSAIPLPGAIVTLPADSVGSLELKPDSVTNVELAPNSVTTNEIVDLTIGPNDLADGAYVGTKFADQSIPWSKITPQTVPAAALQHPIGVTDVDVTGNISGSKINEPIKQHVQFNNADMVIRPVLNFLGTAGLLDMADDAANNRTNINLQGIISNQPAKGTDVQVKAIGGEPGNTIGSANTWSASNHGHQIKIIPVTGQYSNLATLPFAPDVGSAADIPLQRVTDPDPALQLSAPRARYNAKADTATTAARFGQEYAGSGTVLSDNARTGAGFAATGWGRDDTTKGCLVLTLDQSALSLLHAKPGANPIAAWLNRLQMDANGTWTFTPDAGQPSITFGNGRLADTSGNPELYTVGPILNVGRTASYTYVRGNSIYLGVAGGGIVIPEQTDVTYLGYAGNRWLAVYAQNGTIQTSNMEEKLGVTELDPISALVDILNTKIIEYDVTCPTEEDENATMHHVGFVSTNAPTRMLVSRSINGETTTSAEVEANTTASIAIAGVQALAAQLTALTERVIALEAIVT